MQEIDTSPDENCEKGEEDLETKQKQRSYYYDDAHGYEDFDPENKSDDEESED